VDDVNNMDESVETVEQAGGVAERALSTNLDRRTMLKAAVAAGTIAGTWVAPRIQSLGFAPAGAATPCVTLSDAADDLNSNEADAYCEPDPNACCGQSFGDNGTVERFTFSNPPAAGCTEIVVRTISLDCNASDAGGQPPQPRNPDVGQFALVIESFEETVPGACNNCFILSAVLVDSQNRTILKEYGVPNSFSCDATAMPGPDPIGNGLDASLACDDPLLMSDARLAVKIVCNVSGECPPTSTELGGRR
jgi:hypothetical protein